MREALTLAYLGLFLINLILYIFFRLQIAVVFGLGFLIMAIYRYWSEITIFL